ncbi:hypothetical protein HWV62_8585 [Athelia sp. TMB]|nr:hypothetical protein HWV62_8585 [Athelia sp. TMB]
MSEDEPWQVRLRLTDSDSVQSFESGSDLLLSDHTPWHLPLQTDAKYCAALWKLLMRDGVSEKPTHVGLPRSKRNTQTPISEQEDVGEIPANRKGPSSCGGPNGRKGPISRRRLRDHNSLLLAILDGLVDRGDKSYSLDEDDSLMEIEAIEIPTKRQSIMRARMRNLIKQYTKRNIQTLIPLRLRSSDYMDLGELTRAEAQIHGFKTFIKYTWSRNGHLPRSLPFPENARGFLYLHAPLDELIATWQIRFRITDSDSPGSFNSGVDLLWPDGTPWFIDVGTPKDPRWALPAIQERLQYTDVDQPAPDPLIQSLGQPFRVDFQQKQLKLRFVGPDGRAQYFPQRSPFRVQRTTGYPFYNPYTGSAMVCFERYSARTSVLRTGETLVLRILKILTPVVTLMPAHTRELSMRELARQLPIPEEGALVMVQNGESDLGTRKVRYHILEPVPWSVSERTVEHPVVQAILDGQTSY